MNETNLQRRAYAGQRIFDGERFLQDHAVVVEDERVVDLLPLAQIPKDIPLEQRPDCTILPGLIDTHIHFLHWQGPVFLAYGVTAVRDTGNKLDWILKRRAQWRQRAWPRIISLGPLLDGPVPNHPLVARRVDSTKTAIEAVRGTAAAGVDGIKLYVGIEADWLEAMVEESHAAGLKISMHCSGHGVLIAGRAGLDEFYHHDGILADIWPERPPGWLDVWGDPGMAGTWDRQQRVADEIAAMDLTSTPTLAYWDSQWRRRLEAGGYPEEAEHMPADLSRWASPDFDGPGSDKWRRGMEAAQGFTGLLWERGVPTLAGSDTPCGGILPGQSLWRELSLLVESGLSIVEALRAATSAAADFLRRPELGRLQKGAAADMVWVAGDLEVGLPDRPPIRRVLRAGVDYAPDALLAAAREAWDVSREDPWTKQFAWHWQRRRGEKGA
ncbi:MAG: amidohydrolase family protein [Candidatus Latescibacteria bacterium]|nr:amidohydrolase family protein [Candidatus Latescibacterota bacterium]